MMDHEKYIIHIYMLDMFNNNYLRNNYIVLRIVLNFVFSNFFI